MHTHGQGYMPLALSLRLIFVLLRTYNNSHAYIHTYMHRNIHRPMYIHIMYTRTHSHTQGGNLFYRCGIHLSIEDARQFYGPNYKPIPLDDSALNINNCTVNVTTYTAYLDHYRKTGVYSGPDDAYAYARNLDAGEHRTCIAMMPLKICMCPQIDAVSYVHVRLRKHVYVCVCMDL